MISTHRLTDSDDAPVYAVRDHSGTHLGLIRHRWAVWVFEPWTGPVAAADTDLDRLTARLPRLLECRP